MANFIEGPAIGPSDVAAGVPPVGLPPAGGGKEIYFDSSAARAAYLEGNALGNQGGAEQYETASPSEVTPSQPENHTTTNEHPVDEEIMRAAASGKPLTPDLIARLPPPFATRPPGGGFQPPVFTPHPAQRDLSRLGAAELTGLTVRVGRGIVASVNFTGGEPRAKHWARLLRFIEIAAEESDDDAPEPETTPRPRGATTANGSAEASGLPRSAERRKRQNVRGAAKSPELAGNHAGGQRGTGEDPGA
jgi:hypothetical protein